MTQKELESIVHDVAAIMLHPNYKGLNPNKYIKAKISFVKNKRSDELRVYIAYHELCARRTLYPDSTFGEAKELINKKYFK
jgi:hypothetical protein